MDDQGQPRFTIEQTINIHNGFMCALLLFMSTMLDESLIVAGLFVVFFGLMIAGWFIWLTKVEGPQAEIIAKSLFMWGGAALLSAVGGPYVRNVAVVVVGLIIAVYVIIIADVQEKAFKSKYEVPPPKTIEGQPVNRWQPGDDPAGVRKYANRVRPRKDV